MNRIRTLAEVVGFVTLGLLALYGLLALCGLAGPLGLAVEADASAPAAAPADAAILGADIPATMNYQGFVRDSYGDLVTGEYTITASIYGIADGGTSLYDTTVQDVTVRDGLFNIVLGEPPDLLPDIAFSDTPRYIEIALNGGDPLTPLTPRQRVHAVPWALTSATLVDDAQVQGLSSSGDITLAGGSGIIVEGGDIDATGNLNVTGDIDATGNLNVTGDIDATGNLNVTGDIDATGNLSVTGGMTVTQGLIVTGGLTVSPSLVLIKRFENIGNDANIPTDISADEYECVATGWSANYDINEDGATNNLVWTYVQDSVWYLAVHFASHNGEDEDPDVDILCVRREIATWLGKPRDLNDAD